MLADAADAASVLPAGSGLSIAAFHEPRDAMERLAELRQHGAPAVFVIGRTDVNRPALMMELGTRHPEVPIVVAADDAAAGPSRFMVTRAPRSAALLDAVAEACRTAAQRARVRTTLERFNVRLRTDALTLDPRQQQRLVLSRLYLENILEQARDGIFVTDRRGIVALWNHAAEDLFDVRGTGVMGQSIDRVSPALLGLITGLSSARTSDTGELTIDTPGGARAIDVSVSLIADATGASVAVSGIARDVTERRGLQRELEARATALAESNRHKDQFLAMLSHELRTPLNVVLGWAHMLQEGAASGEDARRGLEMIRRNAELQKRLVEDLLDYAGIVAGRLSLQREPTVVARLVRRLVEELKPEIGERGLQLHEAYDDAHEAPVDRDRLRQVLVNLLTNAMKFTPAGRALRVAVRGDARHVAIEVTDTGEGIPPDFLPHIFDEFRQADASSTRRQAGLGLGLAITRRIVELHGGRISVASAGPGMGATFVVTLPKL